MYTYTDADSQTHKCIRHRMASNHSNNTKSTMTRANRTKTIKHRGNKYIIKLQQ